MQSQGDAGPRGAVRVRPVIPAWPERLPSATDRQQQCGVMAVWCHGGCIMRNGRRIGLLVTSGTLAVLALVAFAWTDGGGPSRAEENDLQNCPQPDKWAIAVWGGGDGVDPGEALGSCSEPSVAAAYWIDPQLQAWRRWFAGRPELSDLAPLQHGQGLLVVGSVPDTPTPTPALTSTPLPSQTPTATPTPAGRPSLATA